MFTAAASSSVENSDIRDGRQSTGRGAQRLRVNPSAIYGVRGLRHIAAEQAVNVGLFVIGLTGPSGLRFSAVAVSALQSAETGRV